VQVHGLIRAILRELSWILPNTARALRLWRARALIAADELMREDLVAALVRKRPQSEGAALLAVLAPDRSAHLLSALLAYQLIWDGLDSIHERMPDRANGLRLHRAVQDALQPWLPRHAYYLLHVCYDDGGYMATLVSSCREAVSRLPSFAAIQPLVLREATASSQILSINHDPDDVRRESDMRAWAQREGPHLRDANWHERGAASGAALVTFAALAHVTTPHWRRREIDGIRQTYPWASAAATMLDSYADRIQDAANGDHIYVSYYETAEDASLRTAEMIEAALTCASHMRDQHRHAVVIAAMIAMYLTKDSARTPDSSAHTKQLARSGGSLACMLIPVVRLWRILYALRSS